MKMKVKITKAQVHEAARVLEALAELDKVCAALRDEHPPAASEMAGVGVRIGSGKWITRGVAVPDEDRGAILQLALSWRDATRKDLENMGVDWKDPT